MMECTGPERAGLIMTEGDNVSVAAQLEKLEGLRAKGTLSEAEFQRLKSALVAKTAPRPAGASAWIVGALAAVVVVTVIFLLAMPRHGSDVGTQSAAKPAAQSPGQPAMLPPVKSESLPPPEERAASNMAPAPPAAEPPPTFPTSFDCAQARGLALRLICTNPNLAAQDVQLASLYRRARANAVDPSQLSDQQQEWLAARDSCTNVGCLASVYAARRVELAQWIN